MCRYPVGDGAKRVRTCVDMRALYTQFPEFSSLIDHNGRKYHMCPKDFTIVCIINPVLEAAPSLYAQNGDFSGLKSFGARDF